MGGKPITLLFYRLIISITNAHFLHLRFTVGPSVAILSGLTARDSRFARLRGKLVTVGKLGGKGRAFLFVACSGGARASASVGALFLSLSVANWAHGRRPRWVKASVSLSLHSRPRHRAGPLLAVCSNDGASPRHHRRVCRRRLYARRVLLPAMPSYQAAADELASDNLDGAHTRSAISEIALR